jgi:hypothetical protein
MHIDITEEKKMTESLLPSPADEMKHEMKQEVVNSYAPRSFFRSASSLYVTVYASVRRLILVQIEKEKLR